MVTATGKVKGLNVDTFLKCNSLLFSVKNTTIKKAKPQINKIQKKKPTATTTKPPSIKKKGAKITPKP